MHTRKVAAKHKHFIGLQFRYHVRGKVRTLYSVVSSHCNHEDTKKVNTMTFKYFYVIFYSENQYL